MVEAITSNTSRRGLKHRTGIAVPLLLALLLGALAALVLLPQAQHLRSLRDGVRADATVHSGGTCVLGRCKVRFEADGRTVVANLPPGSGGGKNPAGTPVAVRYRAGDPQTVAAANDVDGGASVLVAAVAGGAALLFLALSAHQAVTLARRKRKA
ncbi:hypothetical protein [Streptomyces sp. NPDC057939]|uniref:hypothetical protein n=1 Tax=Streptomyces sp. NPDC057939 TaxID=3346284 RepID=UPI0036ECA6AD